MSTPQDAAPDVADLSYEEARDELVTLVGRIESGQVPLEDAMLLWERGEALAAHCQAKLDAAQETLDRATAQGAQQPAGAGAAEAHASDDADDAAQDDGS